MPLKPKVTAKAAPRTVPPKPKTPPAKRPGPNRVTAGSSGGAFGASLLNAGTTLGTSFIAAKAANDILDKFTENPLLLAAAGGVVLIFLLR